MINVGKEWNTRQSLLRKMLSKQEQFSEAVKLCLEMHSLVHTSEMSKAGFSTYEDLLWDGLTEDLFRIQPENRNTTIAWNLWHLTRIEDITVNILIADDSQVINNGWLKKMNTAVLDTGNAMTRKEIENLSSEINMKELRNYRIAVGRKTQKIISCLKAGDLKRKMTLPQLNRITDEGGVLQAEGSIWLINFWGRKTVSGILLMPVTRHQVVHLNDALKIKKNYSRKKSVQP